MRPATFPSAKVMEREEPRGRARTRSASDSGEDGCCGSFFGIGRSRSQNRRPKTKRRGEGAPKIGTSTRSPNSGSKLESGTGPRPETHIGDRDKINVRLRLKIDTGAKTDSETALILDGRGAKGGEDEEEAASGLECMTSQMWTTSAALPASPDSSRSMLRADGASGVAAINSRASIADAYHRLTAAASGSALRARSTVALVTHSPSISEAQVDRTASCRVWLCVASWDPDGFLPFAGFTVVDTACCARPRDLAWYLVRSSTTLAGFGIGARVARQHPYGCEVDGDMSWHEWGQCSRTELASFVEPDKRSVFLALVPRQQRYNAVVLESTPRGPERVLHDNCAPRQGKVVQHLSHPPPSSVCVYAYANKKT